MLVYLKAILCSSWARLWRQEYNWKELRLIAQYWRNYRGHYSSWPMQTGRRAELQTSA